MPDGSSGGVGFELDGAHLRVDARPARLVSLLRDDPGPPLVTAQAGSGPAVVEELPDAARQATFRLQDAVSVEATPSASFVAVAGDDGECLVVVYGGEVTVVPGEDRFALAADEALVLGGDRAEPAVVPVAELSAEAHPSVAALLAATAAATLGGAEAPGAGAPEERSEPVAGDEAGRPGGAAKQGPTAKAAPGAKKAAGASKAGAAGGGGRRKKGKKGRPQPQKAATKAAAGAGAAGGAAPGARTAKKAAPPPPPAEPPRGGGRGGGNGGSGGGGGGHGDDSYEDTPRDRRFLVGAILVALVLAVGAVLLLSNVDDDDGTEVASEATTTTEAATETTTSTTAAPTTTEARPAATTTAVVTTTTARAATTTTTRATTTTAATPRYDVEPKSCVQNANSITYIASIRNNADVAFDFTIDVSFTTDDGTQVAKASGNLTRLAPGRTADVSATGRSSRDLAGTGAQCNVVRLDARPSA